MNTQLAAESPAELPADDIFPVVDLPEDAEFGHIFTKSQLAHAMRNRDHSGLSRAVVVIGGKRLFFSRTKLRQWLAFRLEAS